MCDKGFELQKVDRASVCMSECGNKITTGPDEECDDGNFREGDGCDKNCKL